jgi:hypothetical protein
MASPEHYLVGETMAGNFTLGAFMEKNLVSQNVYASFILSGTDLIPQDITSYFGINPSKSFTKGDIKLNGKKWPHGYWALESSEFVKSSDLVNHIEWIISEIEKIEPKPHEIIRNQEITARISCFWILSTGHDGLSLTTDLMKRIANLNISLELDVYCAD